MKNKALKILQAGFEDAVKFVKDVYALTGRDELAIMHSRFKDLAKIDSKKAVLYDSIQKVPIAYKILLDVLKSSDPLDDLLNSLEGEEGEEGEEGKKKDDEEEEKKDDEEEEKKDDEEEEKKDDEEVTEEKESTSQRTRQNWNTLGVNNPSQVELHQAYLKGIEENDPDIYLQQHGNNVDNFSPIEQKEYQYRLTRIEEINLAYKEEYNPEQLAKELNHVWETEEKEFSKKTRSIAIEISPTTAETETSKKELGKTESYRKDVEEAGLIDFTAEEAAEIKRLGIAPENINTKELSASVTTAFLLHKSGVSAEKFSQAIDKADFLTEGQKKALQFTAFTLESLEKNDEKRSSSLNKANREPDVSVRKLNKETIDTESHQLILQSLGDNFFKPVLEKTFGIPEKLKQKGKGLIEKVLKRVPKLKKAFDTVERIQEKGRSLFKNVLKRIPGLERTFDIVEQVKYRAGKFIFRKIEQKGKEIAKKALKKIAKKALKTVGKKLIKQGAKTAVKAGLKIGLKIAAEGGIKAALLAAAPETLGISLVILVVIEIAELLVKAAILAAKKLLKFITGKDDLKSQLKDISGVALILSLATGFLAPAAIFGSIFIFSTGIIPISGFFGAAFSAFTVIISTIILAVSVPIIISIFIFIMLTILITIIINNSAFLVPYGIVHTPTVTNPEENPYIQVTKTATSEEGEEGSYLELPNPDPTTTITYTIEIEALDGNLINIDIIENCTVRNETLDLECPDRSQWLPIPNPGLPTEGMILDGETFIITYTREYTNIDPDNFDDSLVVDTVTVNAEVEGQTAQSDSSSASICFGDCPKDCPQLWPVPTGVLTQGPEGCWSHDGQQAVDIAAPKGTVVYATHEGTASLINSSTGGKMVRIDGNCDGTPFYSDYGHLFTQTVADGSSVDIGDPIGTVDSTGESTGDHVHYEFVGLPMAEPYIPESIDPVPNCCSNCEERCSAFDCTTTVVNFR